MRTGAKLLAGAAALALLAGCGGGDTGAGGVSPEEERALDNAAAMLDSQSNLAVPDDSMVANEEAVAAEENAADAEATDNGQ